MKQFFVAFVLTCLSPGSFAQTDTAAVNDTKRFQGELRMEYDNPNTSPLSATAKKTFKGIHFFPFNKKYVVNARFVRTPKEKPFQMSTSGGIRKTYIKYAAVFFVIDGKEYKLNVYQSQDLIKSAEYKDYLFIPFTDATSGEETYEGGRYIDLNIPQSDHIVINFNKAYHPYCAYTDGYNCPIPPAENTLPVKIEAGVRF
ncbi:DUF1684 domain-containing protein [Parafilimonas sp.]|uniref:DUF1684 domain-containing protein n=1 Tax=Parafilimonas sp. TaxID=1969739 RepID=UPI0039E3EB17